MPTGSRTRRRCSWLAGWLPAPGPGPATRSHLLSLDAAFLQEQQEQLRGQVALWLAAAAQPLHEGEDELRVLGHRQAPVQGLGRGAGWGVVRGHGGTSPGLS